MTMENKMKRGSKKPIKRVDESVKKIRAIDLVKATMEVPIISKKAAKTFWTSFVNVFEPSLHWTLKLTFQKE